MGIQSALGQEGSSNDKSSALVELLLGLRKQAKADKNYALADQLRDQLAGIGIVIKDTPAGTEWSVQ